MHKAVRVYCHRLLLLDNRSTPLEAAHHRLSSVIALTPALHEAEAEVGEGRVKESRQAGSHHILRLDRHHENFADDAFGGHKCADKEVD